MNVTGSKFCTLTENDNDVVTLNFTGHLSTLAKLSNVQCFTIIFLSCCVESSLHGI